MKPGAAREGFQFSRSTYDHLQGVGRVKTCPGLGISQGRTCIHIGPKGPEAAAVFILRELLQRAEDEGVEVRVWQMKRREEQHETGTVSLGS